MHPGVTATTIDFIRIKFKWLNIEGYAYDWVELLPPGIMALAVRLFRDYLSYMDIPGSVFVIA